jgi:TetR/AcrR family tetracycline transcriptional repressor
MAIEREKILVAALAVLNEVGLDQFSTRRLAERLGVQQPALYWHFRNKSELLDELNGFMLARFGELRLPLPGERWDDFTLAHARSFRRALLSVRDGARLNSAREFADAERQLQLYVEAGLTPEQGLGISIGVARYVLGFVLEEQNERERVDDQPELTDDPMQEVANFPILSAALEPIVKGGTINTERIFEAGLAYMVAGIRASLPHRRTRQGQSRQRASRAAAGRQRET